MDTYFADPYAAWHHRNQRAPQRSDPTLPTHTHRLPNHNRQGTAGDHHRDQQPTPKTPQPDKTGRNLPTPHTTTPPQCCTSDLNTGRNLSRITGSGAVILLSSGVGAASFHSDTACGERLREPFWRCGHY